jgi:hypothetical protein
MGRSYSGKEVLTLPLYLVAGSRGRFRETSEGNSRPLKEETNLSMRIYMSATNPM